MDFYRDSASRLGSFQDHADFLDAGIREIVIVDSRIDRYADLVRAAQAGAVGLQFCANGQAALRLARQFRADVWLVASELSDMAGADLVEMLGPGVARVADERPQGTQAGVRNRIAGRFIDDRGTSSTAGRNSRPKNRLLSHGLPSTDHAAVRPSVRRAGERSGIFLVGDGYRVEDEKRALAAGVAGYAVGPMTVERVLAFREPAAAIL